jgi:hypothetical protein
MRVIISFLLSVTFFTCHKDKEAITTPFSEASYKVIVTLNWTSPNFAVPAGAHVTTLTGMVHSKDTFLWMPGTLATPGLEDVAEIGNNTKMNAESDAIIQKNKALSKFAVTPPAVTGTIETSLMLNTNYSYVSFASMIAPSPDWFMGIHDFNLLNGNSWINDVTVDLVIYDAGTEDGDVFGYNNPASAPQQNIALLTPANASVLANGNSFVSPIGSVRFIKN